MRNAEHFATVIYPPFDILPLDAAREIYEGAVEDALEGGATVMQATEFALEQLEEAADLAHLAAMDSITFRP